MDIWTKEKRSRVMANIRSKNTKPEIKVRSLLHKRGYRYRIHKKELPGAPDIVFAQYKTVIFVHGCFWHQHSNCIDGHIPKTHIDMWEKKLKRNVEKDLLKEKKLKEMGWNVITVWECEIEKRMGEVIEKIDNCLRGVIQ